MKDIVSLRNHLFETLNRIADATEDQVDVELSKAASIVQVSEAIIRTAEVENDFIALTRGAGSGFIPVVNNGKSLLQIVKEQQEKPNELFNVDKEKNWVIDEGQPLRSDTMGMETVKLHAAVSE